MMNVSEGFDAMYLVSHGCRLARAKRATASRALNFLGPKNFILLYKVNIY